MKMSVFLHWNLEIVSTLVSSMQFRCVILSPLLIMKKCVGCMMCAAACPKGLIQEKHQNRLVVVKCSSHANGKATRAVCSNGCIGCKKCERVCPSGAIKVEDNLARIDDAKCTGCGECVSNCPVGTIQLIS